MPYFYFSVPLWGPTGVMAQDAGTCPDTWVHNPDVHRSLWQAHLWSRSKVDVENCFPLHSLRLTQNQEVSELGHQLLEGAEAVAYCRALNELFLIPWNASLFSLSCSPLPFVSMLLIIVENWKNMLTRSLSKSYHLTLPGFFFCQVFQLVILYYVAALTLHVFTLRTGLLHSQHILLVELLKSVDFARLASTFSYPSTSKWCSTDSSSLLKKIF